MERPHFRVIIIFIVLLVISFLLITYQLRIKMFAPSFRKVLFDYLSPLEYAVTYIPDSLDYLKRNYNYFLNQKAKIKLLEKENVYLRNMINDLYAYKKEFIRLEKLMGFHKQEIIRYIPVKSIGMSGFSMNRDIIIDRGIDSNIREYDTILSEKGLLGYVVEVHNTFSIVRTIISSKTAVAVYLETDGINGIIKGNGTLTGNLYYVPQNLDVTFPQKVYTSGLDGVFPRNIFVGEVIKYEKDPSKFFYDIYVDLNSSPYSSRYLYLLQINKKTEDDSN